MRRLLIVALTVAAVTLAARAVRAGDVLWSTGEIRANEYRGDDVTEDHYVDGMSHPLRVAAYAVAPFGYAAEWLIFRPLYYVVSRPQLAKIFNYKQDEDVEIRFGR